MRPEGRQGGVPVVYRLYRMNGAGFTWMCMHVCTHTHAPKQFEQFGLKLWSN